jgi:hypothetical protein
MIRLVFKKLYRVGALLSLVVSGITGSQAAVLKVRPWPMSDKSYASISADSVRVERYLSEITWLSQTGRRNPSLNDGLQLSPVASIEVSRLYEDEDIDSLQPLVETAQAYAAKFGANAVFVEKEIRVGDELDGLRFTAYRAEFKKHLIPPTFMVALAQMSIPGPFLEEQLRDWEDVHIGRVAVAFGPDEDHDMSLDKLGQLKSGTSVRVVLRDGSDLQGAVSGLDEDNRLWVRPKGWTGLFRDKAVPATEIRSVALLK